MRPPIFVRSLSDTEKEQLETALRSKDAFVMRRAQVILASEEGLTERRVSGETIRATLSRVLGIRWQRAKRWITSPDPLYERKKAARPIDGGGRREPGVGHRL